MSRNWAEDFRRKMVGKESGVARHFEGEELLGKEETGTEQPEYEAEEATQDKVERETDEVVEEPKKAEIEKVTQGGRRLLQTINIGSSLSQPSHPRRSPEVIQELPLALA